MGSRGKRPSDLYFSALFWGHGLDCSISFLGPGADLGSSGLQLGGWAAAVLSMESCFCFPSSLRGQQSKHELIGCAVWPALFSK